MDLHTLLPAIYATTYEPESWSDVLNRITSELNIVGCNILSFDTQNIELNKFWLSDSLAPLISDYQMCGYNDLDRETIAALLKYGKDSHFTPCRSAFDQIENKTLEHLTSYNAVMAWLSKTLGIEARAAAVLVKEVSFWSMFALQFGDDHREIINDKTIRAEQLLPHVVKAFQLGRPFYVLKQRFDSVLEVLDKFQLGVGLIANSYELILVNNQLSKLIEDNDALSVKNGRFISRQIIAGIDMLHSQHAQNFVYITRKNHAPLQIQLSLTHCMLENNAYAICIVTDPDITDYVNIAAVSQAFNLSPTENRVTKQVVKGLSNTEIAEEYRCSSETVKSHMKSIFNKTGCRSRIDLVNMAHKLSPPIDPASEA